MSERILITYRVQSSRQGVRSLARKIAIEQSVETPESVITPEIEKGCVGQIEAIDAVPNMSTAFDVLLSYPADMLSHQFNQLLNLCFGNVSMYQNVRLTDIKIPESLLSDFDGPQYGVEGVRRLLGVYERPLLATALKPRGQSDEYFSDLAYRFACGGGDIIKDDQNLIGNFESFKSRVQKCVQAIDDGSQKSGRGCFYFPFISAPFEQMEKYFEYAKMQGVRGVLLSPLIIGLDTARGLARKYGLMYMAHPAFTGSFCIQKSHGMNYELLYGMLFRLAGVDISVFPNQGGRFLFEEADCKSIATSLRKPLGAIETAFPCPAGGMHYDDLHTMCSWFGRDSVFLLGGSLLEYSSNVAESTAAFRNKITEYFSESLSAPVNKEIVSTCETGLNGLGELQEILRCEDYHWQGRDSEIYKTSLELPFKDVRRVELIGKFGEKCSFDVRYFEIDKSGYSSLEKHRHTHVIIGARGKGLVIIDGVTHPVGENDIIYVKPLVTHQLRAGENEVFGFYCIVDRVRDKPQAQS